jgi:hypothetical protein
MLKQVVYIVTTGFWRIKAWPQDMRVAENIYTKQSLIIDCCHVSLTKTSKIFRTAFFTVRQIFLGGSSKI